MRGEPGGACIQGLAIQSRPACTGQWSAPAAPAGTSTIALCPLMCLMICLTVAAAARIIIETGHQNNVEECQNMKCRNQNMVEISVK